MDRHHKRKAKPERGGALETRDALRPSTPEPQPLNIERRDATESKQEDRPTVQAHVYGVMPVLEALRVGARGIDRIMIAEGASHSRLREVLELARSQDVPLRRVNRNDLQRVTGAANHQGVVAIIAAAKYRDADELLDSLVNRPEGKALALALDGVEDPRNLGAIIRTAECAGVHAVFIPERRAVGLTETVAKTAAGALEYVPVAKAPNMVRLIEDFKERGLWVVGVEADSALDYTAWDWTVPCALIFGGEGSGLHRLVRERCDALVRIPLHGRITSLNVSVAVGVILYEVLRQRTLQ
ncbi:MAG: 23S rRNA (guanosine(2251)-2'-O)-methyltransferase RlmB [Pyrinomonadaceae bacterium]